MDNDDATIGTILTRREALAIAARAGIAMTAGSLASLAMASSPLSRQKPSVHLVASPQLTEGPFFVDEKLNRSNVLSGTTRSAVISGTPLELEIELYKLTNDKHVPFESAQVDIWHCDTAGVYSDESNPMNHEDTAHQTWLRGYQVTNAKGIVKFQTIVPGWYPGRTTHIHFKIRTFSSKLTATAEFTSQLFFEESQLKKVYTKSPYRDHGLPDMSNSMDNIFAERQSDGSMAGTHLLLDLKPAKSGYASKFVVALTDESMRGGRRGPGQRRPGGPPPSGPPPGGGFGGFDGGWESF